jgi:ABC-type uncharacterized transport system substrate-binding protein
MTGFPVPVENRDQVAIIVSSEIPAYLEVTQALAARLDDRAVKYSLDNASPAVVAELIARSGIVDVIAVGPEAAAALSPKDGYNIVYCQVYKEIPLQAQGYKGVAGLPPFALQLNQWKVMFPDIQTIGVIASPDMGLFVEELQIAVSNLGLELKYEEVLSDKEANFVFQQMVPEIDGYVFLPDTRVLSPLVIRKIMSYGLKHDTSILAYNKTIADLGASLRVTADAEDIADQVVALLHNDAHGTRLPLQRVALRPTLELARRL